MWNPDSYKWIAKNLNKAYTAPDSEVKSFPSLSSGEEESKTIGSEEVNEIIGKSSWINEQVRLRMSKLIERYELVNRKFLEGYICFFEKHSKKSISSNKNSKRVISIFKGRIWNAEDAARVYSWAGWKC